MLQTADSPPSHEHIQFQDKTFYWTYLYIDIELAPFYKSGIEAVKLKV